MSSHVEARGAAREQDRSLRWHALDAARGFVLLLGVAYHASMSFLPGPRVWLVTDAERTKVLSVAFYLSHVFRMTLFFMLAGFFARLSLKRRGLGAFVRERAKRIGLPLVAGWLVLFPAIAGVSLWARAAGQRRVVEHSSPFSLSSFPLTHLWFLYTLLWLYAAVLAARFALDKLDPAGRLGATADRYARCLAGSVYAPCLLALPFTVVTLCTPDWRAWFGVPTPDRGFLINAQALVAFGVAFVVGWLVQRSPELLSIWRARWARYLALAAALSGICLSMVGPLPVITPLSPSPRSAVYALCYAGASFSFAFAIIGIAMRFRSTPSPAVRYVADASYWVYLIHLPIVMALQLLIAPLTWPWFLKFPLLLALSLGLMFASYTLLVRYSLVGAILNGRRIRRAQERGESWVQQPEEPGR